MRHRAPVLHVEPVTLDLNDPRLSDWERHVVTGIAARLRDAAMAAAEAEPEACHVGNC